jgi:hypothetical protein
VNWRQAGGEAALHLSWRERVVALFTQFTGQRAHKGFAAGALAQVTDVLCAYV